MRRKSGEWMTKYDDRILEYIRENQTGRPVDIERDDFIYCSASYIGQRLKELEEHSLVDVSEGPVYQLTKKGRAYLIGAYDAEGEQYLHKVDPQRGARNYQWIQLQMEDLVDDAQQLIDEFSES